MCTSQFGHQVLVRSCKLAEEHYKDNCAGLTRVKLLDIMPREVSWFFLRHGG